MNDFLYLILILLLFMLTGYLPGLVMIISILLMLVSIFFGLKYFGIALILLVTTIFVDYYKSKKVISILKSSESK